MKMKNLEFGKMLDKKLQEKMRMTHRSTLEPLAKILFKEIEILEERFKKELEDLKYGKHKAVIGGWKNTLAVWGKAMADEKRAVA